MKFPAGQGVWPAFWLLPVGNPKGEIDIVEYVYNAGTEQQNMIHNNNLCDAVGNQAFWCDQNYNSQWGYWKAPSSLSSTYFVDDWHVVSCLWENGTTTIYINGFPVSQRRISPAAQPSQIILNLAMGGSWPTTNGNGAAWTQPVSLGPEVFEIDYVRVYQRSA
jgi:beta-glucanase (GH16 family)